MDSVRDVMSFLIGWLKLKAAADRQPAADVIESQGHSA